MLYIVYILITNKLDVIILYNRYTLLYILQQKDIYCYIPLKHKEKYHIKKGQNKDNTIQSILEGFYRAVGCVDIIE